MLNDFIAWKLVKAHQKKLLEEAEIERLLKKSRAGRLRLQDRCLLYVGDLLISLGVRLKERQKPIHGHWCNGVGA